MPESVSIVVPAYNEAAHIGRCLESIGAFAAAWDRPVEIIVVDDGSADATAAIVESFPAQGPAVRLLRHERNLGKGAAVRTGFRAAGGEIVLFTDVDLSAPITEAPRLVDPIAAGRYDIVIGSRAIDPSHVKLHQSLFRRAAGRVFNRLVRLTAGLDFHDTQCGFKAFRRTAAAGLFERQRVGGFAFDVELLFLASRSGLRILEVPVEWSHHQDSRVSLVHHTPGMLADLCRIRWHYWRGTYGGLAGGADRDLPAACSQRT